MVKLQTFIKCVFYFLEFEKEDIKNQTSNYNLDFIDLTLFLDRDPEEDPEDRKVALGTEIYHEMLD